jgi:nitrogen fixation NifU-like protein
MPVYSDKVMDHFMHPRNVGEIADADGVGEVGNPVCGDMMSFYIKVKDNRLQDIKFKTFGCGAAIAVSSMVSEMAMGKTIEDAMKITPQSVADELEGLPKQKFHCSNLGAQALHKAIEDYLSKKQPASQVVKSAKVTSAATKTGAKTRTAAAKAGGGKK